MDGPGKKPPTPVQQPDIPPKGEEGAVKPDSPDILPQLPSSPTPSEESDTPRSKSVLSREAAMLLEEPVNVDWFGFSFEPNPGELYGVMKHYMEQSSYLEREIEVCEEQRARLQASKKKSKKKSRPSGAEPLPQSPEVLKKRLCELHRNTGKQLTNLGEFQDAVRCLRLALNVFDSAWSENYPALIQYDLFRANSLMGDYPKALESLEQSFKQGNYRAGWHLALIRLGMVMEYQIFSDPEQTLKQLEGIKERLVKESRRAGKEVCLFKEKSDPVPLFETIWTIYLPFINHGQDLCTTLSLIQGLVEIPAHDLSNPQTHIDTHKEAAEPVLKKLYLPLIRVLDRFGEEGVAHLQSCWINFDETEDIGDTEATFHVQQVRDTLLKSGCSPELADVFLQPPFTFEHFESLDACLCSELNDVMILLGLSEQLEAGIEKSRGLKADFAKLYQKRDKDQEGELFRTMSQSCSVVDWTRECLKQLKGIDTDRNLASARLKAQCIQQSSPDHGLFLEALCCLENKETEQKGLALLNQAAHGHSHIGSLLALGDLKCKRSLKVQPNMSERKEAFQLYIRAGKKGAAAGYIRAAELLVECAHVQFECWALAELYFIKAFQLIEKQGLERDEQYCQSMADLCQSTFLEEYQLWLHRQQKSREASKPSYESDTEQEVSSELRPEESFPEKVEKPVKKAARKKTEHKAEASRTGASKGGSRSFWKDYRQANDLIRECDLDEAEALLPNMQCYKQPEQVARVQQLKAWLCKARLENAILPKGKTRKQVYDKGMDHVAQGVSSLLGQKITSNSLFRLNIDPEHLSQEQRKCLSSLVSTAEHLISLHSEGGGSRKVKSREAKPLYQLADQLNPARVRRCVEKCQAVDSKLQMVDEDTFTLLKEALLS